LFREAVTNDPAYPDPHIKSGLVFAGRGELNEAEQELIEAAQLAPVRVDVFFTWLLCKHG
jgi:Tfp pilus assembly protein PilF